MLKVSLPEAEKLYDEYWNAVPSLKKLKEVVENFWTATGEKYVKAMDGRLLTSRSKHSLLNVLLQSGGSLTAKYTAVLIQQKLEELGKLGDVFIDTAEESKSKVYQSIIYHDEQQMSVPKDFVKVKWFDTEEEALSYRKEHKLSTPVQESKGRFYIFDRNLLVDIIDESIAEASEHLGLRCEIGYEYVQGRDWAECH